MRDVQGLREVSAVRRLWVWRRTHSRPGGGVKQAPLLDGSAAHVLETQEISHVSVTLQPDGLVLTFDLAGGSVRVLRWRIRDAFSARDLARQVVTLAEGMPGAESLCLC